MRVGSSDKLASPYDRVDNLLDRLDRVRRSGKGWTARCPAHEDRWPSLSIHEGDDGRALIHCHSGCSADEIVRAVGLGLRDLFPRTQDHPRPRRTSRKRPNDAVQRWLVAAMLDRPGFGTAWEMAWVMAELPHKAAADEADAIPGDADLVLHLADLIRGVAVANFAQATDYTPRYSEILDTYLPGPGPAAAVGRLSRALDETPRGAAA